MKLRIQFFLNDETETEIFSVYDATSNPFSLNDEIYLKVNDLFPVDYNKYKIEQQQSVMERNNSLIEKFNRKKVKLVKEGKYADFNLLGEVRLVIEFHCELIDK